MSSPLISAADLQAALQGPVPPVLLDVRWDLAHGARHDLFRAGHLPGAVFVDLGAELADPPAASGAGGRHPLPEPGRFSAAMRSAGVSARRPVVAYDGTGGLAAARAWWLLRHHGHDAVTVLDGGLDAWRAAGGSLACGPAQAPVAGDFVAAGGRLPVLDADGAWRTAGDGVLIDARAAERFRGTTEPVDPVAGHVPGARSRPTTENLAADGCFASPAALREAFAALGARPGVTVGVHCGSGVTACHELLALEAAGVQGAALYAGSWSDWISDPSRPVARD
ncbi:MAG TPA: sulfurtransferase [Solirubrobacteraceae bacterium]|nr:sulfurtransferase [Solirubrobacteraceae bacterium]